MGHRFARKQQIKILYVLFSATADNPNALSVFIGLPRSIHASEEQSEFNRGGNPRPENSAPLRTRAKPRYAG